MCHVQSLARRRRVVTTHAAWPRTSAQYERWRVLRIARCAFFVPFFGRRRRRRRRVGTGRRRRRRRARVVVTRATVRDVRDSTRWDTRKRSHRATASAVSAVRAHTRDWCVRDRATDGRARDLDYSRRRA